MTTDARPTDARPTDARPTPPARTTVARTTSPARTPAAAREATAEAAPQAVPEGGHAAAAAQAWTAMRTLVLDVHDRRAAVSEALGLSFIRAKALTRLAAGALTMRELAGQLGTDPPYTTVVVDDLEGRELVRRSTSPEDRRVKIVTLTESGARAAAAATAILSEPPPALAALDAGDLAELARILTRLVERNVDDS